MLDARLSSIQKPLGDPHTPLTNVLVPGFSAQDSVLLHHWWTTNSLMISADPQKQSFWHFKIPEVAKQHKYLMHNLLAMSAIHSASVRPQNQQGYRRLAAHHQLAAAREFRLAVQSVSAENCTAVCASTGMTILVELGLFKHAQDTDPILELLDKFKLIQKSVPIWQNALPLMLQNPDSRILLKVSPRNPIGSCSTVYNALLDLGKLLYSMPITREERRVYQRAIELLMWDFSVILVRTPAFEQAMRWGDMVDDKFIRLVQLKEPVALIILAHYCVLLSHATDVWCFEGWADRVLEAIAMSIDDSMVGHLSWAMQAMKIQPDGKTTPLKSTRNSSSPADGIPSVVVSTSVKEPLFAGSDADKHPHIEESRLAPWLSALRGMVNRVLTDPQAASTCTWPYMKRMLQKVIDEQGDIV